MAPQMCPYGKNSRLYWGLIFLNSCRENCILTDLMLEKSIRYASMSALSVEIF